MNEELLQRARKLAVRNYDVVLSQDVTTDGEPI